MYVMRAQEFHHFFFACAADRVARTAQHGIDVGTTGEQPRR
jgi:hypothetical protein